MREDRGKKERDKRGRGGEGWMHAASRKTWVQAEKKNNETGGGREGNRWNIMISGVNKLFIPSPFSDRKGAIKSKGSELGGKNKRLANIL